MRRQYGSFQEEPLTQIPGRQLSDAVPSALNLALSALKRSSGEQVGRSPAHEFLHVSCSRLALDENGVGHDGFVERNRGFDTPNEIFA